MHIETEAHSPRHRHFLAAPVALAVLVAVVLVMQGDTASMATVIQPQFIAAEGGDREWKLPNGLSGILREDAALSSDGTQTDLLRGTALVASASDLSVWAGEWQLRTFDGSLMVSRSGEEFTVYALTSPVLVRRMDDRFVVPAGMMMKSTEGELERMPESLLMGQLAILKDVTAVPLSQEVPEALQPLSSALRTHDSATAHRLLGEEATRQGLLSFGPGASLIRTAAFSPSIVREFAPYIQDADLWLVVSLHSRYRLALADSIGPLTLSQSIRDLRWLVFPLCDMLAQAAPELVVEEWIDQVRKSVATRRDSAGFTDELFTALAMFRTIAEEKGWSERLMRYAAAADVFAEAAGADFDPNLREELTAWRAIDDVLPPPEDLPPPTVEPPAEPEQAPVSLATAASLINPIEAQALVQQARDIFQAVGALFVPATTLKATGPQQVKIENLIFATATGEHAFSFILDIDKQQVSAIQQNDQILPLGLPLQKFTEWAKAQ